MLANPGIAKGRRLWRQAKEPVAHDLVYEFTHGQKHISKGNITKQRGDTSLPKLAST